MKRSPLLLLPVALVTLSLQASAQPPPLPTLPPPATGAAPSTLNPSTPPPVGAPPVAITPAPLAPSAPPPSSAPPPPGTPPPPPGPPTAPFDGTAAPTDFTQVTAPHVAPEPEPPPPIAVTGPGTFTHDGFYMRIGSGAGGLALLGSGPFGSARVSGVSSNTTLSFGGTPSRGFVVGGAISVASLSSVHWSGVDGNLKNASTANIAAFVDWFPSERKGWHVGGMLGFGFTDISAYDQGDRSGLGLGGEVFGGYDLWIGPQWSLGLQGSFNFVTKSTLKDDNQNDTGYSLGAVGGALEVTLLYH